MDIKRKCGIGQWGIIGNQVAFICVLGMCACAGQSNAAPATGAEKSTKVVMSAGDGKSIVTNGVAKAVILLSEKPESYEQ